MGLWIYGGCFQDDNKSFIIFREDGFIKSWGVVPETVAQYTGIKENKRENNEKWEIYFGDKVKCYGGEYCQGTWEYSETIIIKSFWNCIDIAESEYVEIIG